VRHHAASLVATATDFVTMVGVVELAGASPVIATAIGAAAGAVVNFLLGRHWIYEHGNGTIHGQALRYLIVTVASLGLNTGGVYLLAGVLGLHYFPARVITALVVSNGWNYPMQRFFVFAASRRSAA
jgi:putative flippase GtrA